MGGELVGLPPFNPKEKPTQERIFWDAYPAYLAMGMSSDDYWNGDAQMCVAYRKAREEKMRLDDAMLWRQGLYIYHALCEVAPYFNSLKPQKPHDYLKEPFGFIKEEPKKEDTMQGGLAFVKAWADRVNNLRKQNGK